MIFGPDRDVLEIAPAVRRLLCRRVVRLVRALPDRDHPDETGGGERSCAGRGTQSDIVAMEYLANTVARMSRCGLGQTALNPILTTLRNFPELYEARLAPAAFLPRLTLQRRARKAPRCMHAARKRACVTPEDPRERCPLTRGRCRKCEAPHGQTMHAGVRRGRHIHSALCVTIPISRLPALPRVHLQDHGTEQRRLRDGRRWPAWSWRSDTPAPKLLIAGP